MGLFHTYWKHSPIRIGPLLWPCNQVNQCRFWTNCPHASVTKVISSSIKSATGVKPKNGFGWSPCLRQENVDFFTILFSHCIRKTRFYKWVAWRNNVMWQQLMWQPVVSSPTLLDARVRMLCCCYKFSPHRPPLRSCKWRAQRAWFTKLTSRPPL